MRTQPMPMHYKIVSNFNYKIIIMLCFRNRMSDSWRTKLKKLHIPRKNFQTESTT